jgi:UDP-2,4-diacetamido-2,4,6-trideoxy-beta-L-altropyranose hydrolase
MCAAPILLIRADASVSIGTGHIMRMIALGQAWQDTGGRVIFLCAQVTPPLEQRIFDENFQLEKLATIPGDWDDFAATSAAITRHVSGGQSVAVALDGYHFDANFQLGLRETGCRLLVVDDYGHCDHYHADWVLNQNISACEELYSNRALGARLLLGPKFALLRREFMAKRGSAHIVADKARKLLVTLGGADADNVTKKVIDASAGTGLEVRVAVGGSNPHLPSLREAVEEVSRGATKVDLVVNSNDMPQLMAWADMAVAAAGSTSWELAFSGLPTLFIILADNQAGNAREMERRGFGLCLGEHSEFDQQRFRDSVSRLAADRPLRADFASCGIQMVDGRGAARVARALVT